jgi:hypothetical protein
MPAPSKQHDGENRRNFVEFFFIFGRIRTPNGKKATKKNRRMWRKKYPYIRMSNEAASEKREEEKKDWLKLMAEKGRRRSPLHIISKAYFQGELTTEKKGSTEKKIIFECEFRCRFLLLAFTSLRLCFMSPQSPLFLCYFTLPRPLPSSITN